MLTVEEAIARIVGDVVPMPVEVVPLADAYGRWLAEDLRSTVDVPPWDNSAMDGYAVRAADTDEGEVGLRLLEVVGAGFVAAHEVTPGSAVGIMTGAPMPAGADAVVMVEDTDGAREGMVRIRGRATPGAHIRRRGEDVKVGDLVLPAGQRLTPAAVGMVASLGRATVAVRRRVVVAVLSTGDEVVPAGQPLRPGQIWSSNNATLVGLAHEAGAVPLDLGIVGDRLEDVVLALRSAVASADVVITTGGVSVGAYDVVKEAYGQIGAEIDFWRVRMKPGKPLAFGRVGPVPLFGLPGNPVSCMVNFLQFVRPYLRISVGDPRPYLPVVEAIAGDDFRESPGRARLIRVVLERDGNGFVVHPTGSQSSGVLTSMVRANGLLLVGVESSGPVYGDAVRVQVLDGSFLDGTTPDYGW